MFALIRSDPATVLLRVSHRFFQHHMIAHLLTGDGRTNLLLIHGGDDHRIAAFVERNEVAPVGQHALVRQIEQVLYIASIALARLGHGNDLGPMGKVPNSRVRRPPKEPLLCARSSRNTFVKG